MATITPRLQVSDTKGQRVVSLDKPLFRIGRRHESELQIVSTEVSREHAEIERNDSGRWLLRDRNSRYGTFANDKPITEHLLTHGDRIRLGRSGGAELVFLIDDTAPVHGARTYGDHRLQADCVASRQPARDGFGACWTRFSRW